MRAETPRHAAFVSYRRMPRDRRWAISIMRALEIYPTPKPPQRKAVPDRHPFRDAVEEPGIQVATPSGAP